MQTTWMTASERLNRFVHVDNNLGRQLADLSIQDASETKLGFALESGRIYGLRQQKYDHILRRQLHKAWRNPPERMW